MDATKELLETTAQLQGKPIPNWDNSIDQQSYQRLADAERDAGRYKAERNQKMYILAGAAGVLFLAGIICVATAPKKVIQT